jgi:hypothetical protein
MNKARGLLSMLSLAVLGFSSTASAAQVWPFQFDPNLDKNPTTIQSQLASGGASLPPLPMSELTMLTTESGTMSLWLWPQNASLLTAIGSASTTPMVWPTTAAMCAKHEAFTMPALTATGTTCTNAATQITQEITANLSACTLTEQPERYVLSYKPSDVASDVGNLEDMIGLAGEAFTHAGPPPAGILPPDFVPTLRSVIAKIRHDKLAASLAAASKGYAQAQSLLSTNASCFDPTVEASLKASLTDLANEATAIAAYLDKLEKDGEAAATHETVCLAANSRVRNTLPYPGLTQADREFIAFWLGATYWRMRGGGLIPLGSTQQARLYYADDGFTQIAAMLGGSDGNANNVGTPFLEELVLDGWSDWQSMGTNGDDKYADIIGFSERGQRQVATTIKNLQPLGYDTNELLTGALQMGPGYYYAYYPLGAFRYAPTMPSPYSGFIDAATAIGELNIGGALGVGLAKTLLPGKPTGAAPTVTLCTGRECGDDGCGGSCGSCQGGAVCNASGQCAAPGSGAGSSGGGSSTNTNDAGNSGGSSSSTNGGDNAGADDTNSGTNAGASGGGCAVTESSRGAASSGLLLGALGVLGTVRRRHRRRSK